MIIKAVKELGLDVNKSFMVGDKYSDLMAAKKSNIRFYFKNGCLLKLVKKIINN